MTVTPTAPTAAATTTRAAELKLEVVVLPVSDFGRAREFYADRLGWRLDADFDDGDGFHLAQVTPPGSEASVIFGTGVSSAAPGTVEHLVLAVSDMDAAREDLSARGVEVSEVFHDAGGVFVHGGTAARVPGRAAEGSDYATFATFADPDGNAFLLQEIKVRFPGRVTPKTVFDSAAELAATLERAAAAHGEHEARTGEADAEWPAWYAEYIVREQAGEELPT